MGITGGIEELDVVVGTTGIVEDDVVEVDEVVGGTTTLVDEEEITPLHTPNSGLHPVPQYSIALPQYQNWEQHCPKPDPAHVVLLPHIPFVEVRVEEGNGGNDTVLEDDVLDVEDEVVLLLRLVVGVGVGVGVGIGVGVGVGVGTAVVGSGSPSQYPKSGWQLAIIEQ